VSSGAGSLFICINVASDRQQQAEEDAVVSFSFKLDVRWGITRAPCGLARGGCVSNVVFLQREHAAGPDPSLRSRRQRGQRAASLCGSAASC